MELHQLRYFESAARLGSMAAAAAECHVSQPALSVQIRKLEDEAGLRLFVREPRGVRLTLAGERTLALARRMLAATEGWRGEMRSGSFAAVIPARLAVQPFISAGLIPRTLASMLRSGTRQRLRLLERPSSEIPSVLRSGEADAALMDLNGAPARGFQSRLILEFPYALFAPPRSPLAASSKPVSLAEALSQNFLLTALAPGIAEALRAAGREPIFSGDHATAIFELVVAGAGVAVLPAHLSAQATRQGVRVRPLLDYAARVSIGLLWRLGEQPPEVASLLADRLRAAYPSWAA
jgi:DNA-binding transcriptional LysR family regulator